MTTMKARYIPLFIVLTLTLTVYAAAYAEDYTVGLGVSDYEARPRITVGSSLFFEVARVSNQGTLNLTVTPIYVPDYDQSQSGLTVVFAPNATTLAPQEDVIIIGEVAEALAVGSFSGRVEFKTAVILPANTTGNPSTPGGSSKVVITIIEVPPIANFSWNPQKPGVGEQVSFDASRSTMGWDGVSYNLILSYNWSFGDGNTTTGKVVSHVYNAQGNYTVTLNVMDSLESVIVAKQIQVGEPTGTASFPFFDVLKVGLPTGLSVTTVAGYIYLHRRKSKRHGTPFRPTSTKNKLRSATAFLISSPNGSSTPPPLPPPPPINEGEDMEGEQ